MVDLVWSKPLTYLVLARPMSFTDIASTTTVLSNPLLKPKLVETEDTPDANFQNSGRDVLTEVCILRTHFTFLQVFASEFVLRECSLFSGTWVELQNAVNGAKCKARIYAVSFLNAPADDPILLPPSVCYLLGLPCSAFDTRDKAANTEKVSMRRYVSHTVK